MVEFKESKFYKLLQDFFINNNKETFIQFLAEFYNRTEGIIIKNDVQDEIIKELRELFIKFNEEGIDENIVREKVNYFVENNEKIQDIITKIIKNKNNIENITSQLDNMAIETRSKRLQGENTKNDSKGTFDSANFAGQDLGKDAPIGNVMHHYTDGICFQIDNVGEDNKILILKNAYNPSRRPDKANNFVGTGDFLSCLTGVIGGVSRNVFIINRDGNIIYKDKLTTAEFINNKPSDSNVAFRFDVYNKHTKLFEIKNGMKWDFSISNASDKCVIQNGNGTQNGIKIESILGGIDISSANNISLVTQNNTGIIYVHGKIKELLNGTYTEVQPIYSGASGARPTTDLIPGFMFFDKTLNKPIWRNKDNDGWVDAMGTSV